MITTVRFASSQAGVLHAGGARVALLSMLAFGSAAWAAGPDKCVAIYNTDGGKLMQVDSVSFGEGMPYEFASCGGFGCKGVVELEGTVQPDGRLRDVAVARSSYGSGAVPDARKVETFRRWFTKAMRYEPPRLNGKPVCVSMAWRYNFR